VFPPGAPDDIGVFELHGDAVTMRIRPGVDVRVDGKPVVDAVMATDNAGAPTIAVHEALAWTVIRRDRRFAVRLRDFENPAIEAFAPIGYYPADESLRVTATLRRYPEPRIVRVDTVIAGLDYRPSSPGVLQFEIGGQPFDLEAYDLGQELLIVFGDATTGVETYPAGRFLYVALPGSDGMTVLDFNTAQNPPCAFNEYATCPIAAPRNRLAVAIDAGERYRPSGH